MDEDYLKQFNNENIEQILLNIENISLLEELLYAESQELLHLQQIKDKLNFGPTLKKEDLKILLPEIKEKVDSFLDVSCDIPAIGYFSLINISFEPRPTGRFVYSNKAYHHYAYLYKFGKILQKRDNPRAIIIPSIGHEYTHSIQYQKNKNILSQAYWCFREGHSRGVQRFISKQYRNIEHNDAFLYINLNYTVGEMKSSYLWISNSLGFKPQGDLLRVQTLRDEDEKCEKNEFGKPTPQAIGNTLFYLYEHLRGNMIYRDMLHGDFKF